MSSHRLAALLAISLLPLAWVPPAAAHCPPGSAGALLGAVSTCQFNDEAELAVEAFNAANGGQVVMVLVKDVGFHPPVVTIRSGGTVVFVYADTDQSLQHDPRSSGGCAPGGAPLPDPVGCVPVDARAGVCFDVTDDDGIPMSYNGQTYPLTFRHFPASGLTQKSRGFMTGSAVGDLTGAQPFRNCPAGNTVLAGGDVVLPYHCGVHGASGTQQKQMRGAIVIEG